MKIIESKFTGVFQFIPEIHHDQRGKFLEIYNSYIFQKINISSFSQQNLVFSKLNVIRGMHAQKSPHQQHKLVSVLRGSILDVIYDMREGSPNYGETLSFNLDDESFKSIYIPPGFAHGYQALSEETIVLYAVSGLYRPDLEIRLNPMSDKFVRYWNTPYIVGDLDNMSDKIN